LDGPNPLPGKRHMIQSLTRVKTNLIFCDSNGVQWHLNSRTGAMIKKWGKLATPSDTSSTPSVLIGTPNGGNLFSNISGTITNLSLSNQKRLPRVSTNTSLISLLEVSGDSKWLFAGGYRDLIQVDLSGDRQIKIYKDIYRKFVLSMQVTSDNNNLVSLGEFGNGFGVKIISIVQQICVKVYQDVTHAYPVAVKLTPDDKR
jgi:hypothetical protein